MKAKPDEVKEKDIDEYAVELMKNKKRVVYNDYFSGTITFPSSGNPINELTNCMQLKITCTKCGYTRVYNTDKFNVADEL